MRWRKESDMMSVNISECLIIVSVSCLDAFILLVSRNYDPSLHPFEVSREYTRALNATKLERVFAKPFLASLDGHRDGVNCMAKHTKNLSTLLSGSCDGEVNCLLTGTLAQNKDFKMYLVLISAALNLFLDLKVKVWNLTKHECVRTLQAHEGFVRGIIVRYCGTSFFTVNNFDF